MLNRPGPQLVRGIPGVIVEFAKSRGIVLLQHKSFQTLDEMLAKYGSRDPEQRFWRARFHWAAIDEDFKRKIGRSGNLVKGKTMIGRQVRCRVVKDEKWEVAYMIIDFDERQISVPPRPVLKGERKRKGKRRAVPKSSTSSFTRARMSGKRGIVLPGAGGRKPGSHSS